jgi:O-antigen ligase
MAGWMVLPDQYKSRYETMLDDSRDADEVSSGRIAIWENGIRMFVARPVYGVGANAFRAANRSGEYGPPQDMQPHSLYIQLFATMGLVGAVVWFWFLGNMIRNLVKARPPNTEEAAEGDDGMADDNQWFDIIRQGMLGTIVGLLVSGFFGHSLYRYTW